MQAKIPAVNPRPNPVQTGLSLLRSRGDHILLAVLFALALIGGCLLVGGQPAPSAASFLFQSDPNSQLPTPSATPTWTDTALATATPTWTDTPPFAETPTWTSTPPFTETPTGTSTPSFIDAPTGTSTPLPSDTPFLPPTPPPLIDTPTPAAPLPPQPEPTPQPDLPPAAINTPSTFFPPMPTPIPTPVPLPYRTPTPTPTAEVTPTEPVIALEPPAPPSAPAEEPGLDLALFIDNLVIAVGYFWLCCGALVVLGGLAGGAWLMLRKQQAAAGPATPMPSPARPRRPGPGPGNPRQSAASPPARRPVTTRPPDSGNPFTPAAPPRPRSVARHGEAGGSSADHSEPPDRD